MKRPFTLPLESRQQANTDTNNRPTLSARRKFASNLQLETATQPVSHFVPPTPSAYDAHFNPFNGDIFKPSELRNFSISEHQPAQSTSNFNPFLLQPKLDSPTTAKKQKTNNTEKEQTTTPQSPR
jgi:hypothetical protein